MKDQKSKNIMEKEELKILPSHSLEHVSIYTVGKLKDKTPT